MIKVMDVIDEIEKTSSTDIEYDNRVVSKFLQFKDHYLIKKPKGLAFTDEFELVLTLKKKEVNYQTQV